VATTVESKEYPIAIRLPAADVAMIDRAASLRARSRTEFVRDAAVRAAEEVVMEQGQVRMSPEGFADFMEVLSSTTRPLNFGGEVSRLRRTIHSCSSAPSQTSPHRSETSGNRSMAAPSCDLPPQWTRP